MKTIATSISLEIWVPVPSISLEIWVPGNCCLDFFQGVAVFKATEVGEEEHGQGHNFLY